MNKTRSLLLFFSFFIFLLVIPGYADAAGIENSVIIEKGQVIEKSIYIISQSLVIDGEVNGDVFCITQNLVITGKVNGDVLCLTNNVKLHGIVEGNARILVSNNATLNGQIKKNANIIASQISTENFSSIGGDLLARAEEAVINGNVGRNIEGSFDKVSISGHVGGNVTLDMSGSTAKATINDQAYVGGALNYKSAYKNIIISKEASVKGKITHDLKKPAKEKKKVFGFIWFYSLFTCLIIGLLLASLAKNKVKRITLVMSEKSSRALTRGILLFFLTPGVLVLLIVTIIGIPLAFILALLIFIAILLAKIIAGIWLGEKILKKAHWQENNLILATLIGITTAKLLFTIPFLGWLLSLVAIIFATGAIWVYFQEKKIEKRALKKTPAPKIAKKKITGKK